MKSSRLWIGITLSLFALGACDDRKAVFVDLSRAEQALAGERVESPGFPTRLAGAPSSVVGLELPPTPHLSAEAGARADQVGALLKEAVETTRKELMAAFEKDALLRASAEIAAVRSTLGETLGEFDAKLMDEAAEVIRQRALERGRMIARLAFLAGFPPGRTRKVPVPWRTALDEEWAKEADQLRRDLLQWDDETYRRIEELVASHHSLQARAREQVEGAVEAIRAAARRSAESRVQEAMTAVAGLRLEDLMADKPLALPALTGGSFVEVPTVNLKISSPEIDPAVADLPVRSRVKRNLEIFLRLHGYKLAKPGEGKDVTGEFILWLEKRLSGHLQN